MTKVVIVGCHQYVCNMEDEWYRERKRISGLSDRKIAALAVLWPSLALNGPTEFKPFQHVNDKVVSYGIGRIDPALVNRGLELPVSVGYYSKKHDNRNGKPGTNTMYSETKYVSAIKKLVSDPITRCAIYIKIRQLGILERHIRICSYVGMILRKYGHVDKMEKISKVINQSEDVEDYKQQFIEDSKSTKDKTTREMFVDSCKLAEVWLKETHWNDQSVTMFLMGGGISFLELVESRKS